MSERHCNNETVVDGEWWTLATKTVFCVFFPFLCNIHSLAAMAHVRPRSIY